MEEDCLFSDVTGDGILRRRYQRFLNTRYGAYTFSGNRYWVDMLNDLLVTQEYVFEDLSEEDKLIFAFNFDKLAEIKSDIHAIQTKEEFDHIMKIRLVPL